MDAKQLSAILAKLEIAEVRAWDIEEDEGTLSVRLWDRPSEMKVFRLMRELGDGVDDSRLEARESGTTDDSISYWTLVVSL